MGDAAELKEKGNEFFKSKQFGEAVVWYTKAIDADSRNYVLFNNRAAAHFSAGNNEACVADCKRSLELHANAKAHSRLGAAFWAMGRLEQALGEYEITLALSPGDATASQNVAVLQGKLRGRPGGDAAPTGGGAGGRAPPPALSGTPVEAAVDVAVVVAAVAQFLLSMLSPELEPLVRMALYGAMGARCLMLLRAQGMLASFSAFRSSTSVFAGQYLLLMTVMLFLRAPSIPTLIAAIAIYALVDLATTQRGAAAKILPGFVEGRLDQVRNNTDLLLLNAAMCEIMSFVFAFFSGSALMLGIIMFNFLARRYKSDTYTKMAFGQISQGINRVAYHPRCPGVVGSGMMRVRDGISSFASR